MLTEESQKYAEIVPVSIFEKFEIIKKIKSYRPIPGKQGWVREIKKKYLRLALLLAHLSLRLIGELIVYRSSRRPCVRPLTLSNMNISASSWPIEMKFYLKHYWGGGKASVRLDPDRIRTLVSMATDGSHRVVMEKNGVITFSRMLLMGSFSYLQVTMTCMSAWMSSKFGWI